jgi:predicted acylesterase/phospholipase RssA
MRHQGVMCSQSFLAEAVRRTQSNQIFSGWRPERCDRVALVPQGGGAFGAYQADVYQALHEADIEPDWVSGMSIGAINSAIIAGNQRRFRLQRLRTFWERLTERKVWSYTPTATSTSLRATPRARGSRCAQSLVEPCRRKDHDELLR